MADVAQLGISVDSSQAKTASADLKGFAAAAATAEQASTKLAQAGQKSETAFRSIDAAAKTSGTTVAATTSKVEANAAAQAKMATASQAAVKGLEGLSTASKKASNDNESIGRSVNSTANKLSQLTPQVNDIVGGLVGGQSPLTILAQQGTQISQIFTSSSRSVTGALMAMGGVIVIGGLVAVAQALGNIRKEMAATADIAPRAGLSGQTLQGLQTAAAYKGIGNDDLNSAMMGFNREVDQAKHGIGDLQTLLRTNGKTVSDTATTFGSIADLVRNAGSESQKFSILQQAGLPATREFARLMEQGGDSITRQAAAATKLSDQQLADAKRLEDRWNEMWINFSQWGKKAVLDVQIGLNNITKPFAHQGTLLGGMLQGMGYNRPEDPNSPRQQGLGMLKQGMGTQLGANAASSIYNATGAFGKSASGSTFDPALAKQQIALEQQRLGLLSPLATAEDVVRQKQLEINAAALNNVGISKQQADGLKLIALAQFEQYRVQQQASIGVFDFAKAQKAANDNLQALVAQKLLDPKNPEQWAAANMVAAKSIDQLRDSALVAAAPLEGLQRLANEAGSARTQLDQFAVTSFNAVTPALSDMLLGTTSLTDGFKNLGTSIVKAATDAVIKLTIIKPLIDSLQSSLSGSGLFSALGIGTGTVANGGITLGGANGPTPFAAANGGTFGPGWGIVGERGPELINVHSRGVTVVPNHISKPYLPGFADGGMLSASGGVTRLPFGQNNAPNITFNVIEDTKRAGQREQSTSSNGDTAITQYVDSITAKNAANPGSATSQVLNQRGRLASR